MLQGRYQKGPKRVSRDERGKSLWGGGAGSGWVVRTGERGAGRYKCGSVGEVGVRRMLEGLEGYRRRLEGLLAEGGTAAEWGRVLSGYDELMRRGVAMMEGLGAFMERVAAYHTGDAWTMPEAAVKALIEVPEQRERGRRAARAAAAARERGLSEEFERGGEEVFLDKGC